MATKIALVIGSDESEGKSKVFELSADFETVLNGVVPAQAPSSALEQRANCTHVKTDGSRVFVIPQHVGWIEEEPSE